MSKTKMYLKFFQRMTEVYYPDTPEGETYYPNYQPTPLKRVSLCPCGFKFLHTWIGLGHIHYVDFGVTSDKGTISCVGCKRKSTVVLVAVKDESKGEDAGAWLPIELFQDPPMLPTN